MQTLKILYGLLLFTACRTASPKAAADVHIDGSVPAVPNGMVYLVKAGQWRSPLDSAISVNGKFFFRLPADSSFIPFDAAIHYYPQGDREHPVRLRFQNPFHPGAMLDHFWAEAGPTVIRALSPKNMVTRIEAGPETRLLFRHQFNDIGWAGDADSTLRREKIKLLEKEISDNPSSWFLLTSLARFKEQYSGTEIQSLFNRFSPRLQGSEAGRKLTRYLSLQVPEGTAYPSLQIPGPVGDTLTLFRSGARVEILVFWASWCVPCRKEIPLLKALQQRYAAGELSITSISIDQDEYRWRKALSEERMPWKQGRIPENQLEDMQSRFRFTTIPFLVITDDGGREIARFKDYDEAAPEEYEKIINARIR